MFYLFFYLFASSVYKNGEVLTPPVKVVLNKHTLNSFESVMIEVTLKVKLQNGAALRLAHYLMTIQSYLVLKFIDYTQWMVYK